MLRLCYGVPIWKYGQVQNVSSVSDPRVTLLPTHDIGVLIDATRPTVAAKRVEIETGGVVLAGTLVLIRLPPRIERHGFLQIRSAPIRRHGIAGGLLLQRGKPLLGGRVHAVVEPVIVERETE